MKYKIIQTKLGYLVSFHLHVFKFDFFLPKIFSWYQNIFLTFFLTSITHWYLFTTNIHDVERIE
jgi:hypothetical protein